MAKQKLELGKEYPDPSEKKTTEDLIRNSKASSPRDASGLVLRNAHTKHHGCVKADFIVEPDLPDELRVGVFKEPRTYEAIVRFTNASPMQQSDKKKDMLGSSIKVLGVEGKKILPGEEDSTVQDFTMQSSESFPTKTPADFARLAPLLKKSIFHAIFGYFLYPRDPKPKDLVVSLPARKNNPNPLEVEYWSATPYRFGERAIKFSIKPHSSGTKAPKNKTYNYRREIMARQLADGEAVFDFNIQFQLDPYKHPIEDPRVKWDSPAIKLATLKIPAQVFDTPEQLTACENLSYNGWHSLPEHRPMGGMNRVREQLYQQLSAFRHEENDVPITEPTTNEKY